MSQPTISFSDKETWTLGQQGFALYRNKVILNRQQPISKAQLMEIEKKVDGKVPSELLDLWKVSFGGEVDYDFELTFGDHLYKASFRELFYPGSDGYHDLDGWINHELEMAKDVALEHGTPVPTKIPYIPFGGFEYLERFYVSLRPDEYGSVIVYAQGIPWKGRLNENSIAVVAGSVAELFDQLTLDEDPFDPASSEHATGKEMAEYVNELEYEHPKLAGKLKRLIQSQVFDWQSIIETANFVGDLSAHESKALRLALEYAVTRRNLSIIDRLYQKAAPFNVTMQGTSGLLGFAMRCKAFNIVSRLLELKVDLGNAPVLAATDCPDELLVQLIHHGVQFDPDAIYTAAETGAIDGALALANSDRLTEPLTAAQIVAGATERAKQHDQDAVKVETGKLGSYLTPEQYREQAKALREFAKRLKRQK